MPSTIASSTCTYRWRNTPRSLEGRGFPIVIVVMGRPSCLGVKPLRDEVDQVPRVVAVQVAEDAVGQALQTALAGPGHMGRDDQVGMALGEQGVVSRRRFLAQYIESRATKATAVQCGKHRRLIH